MMSDGFQQPGQNQARIKKNERLLSEAQDQGSGTQIRRLSNRLARLRDTIQTPGGGDQRVGIPSFMGDPNYYNQPPGPGMVAGQPLPQPDIPPPQVFEPQPPVPPGMGNSLPGPDQVIGPMPQPAVPPGMQNQIPGRQNAARVSKNERLLSEAQDQGSATQIRRLSNRLARLRGQ